MNFGCWPYLARVGLLAGLYFGAGKLGLALAVEHGNVSPVWPPAGLALAALLILGRRFWPGIMLGAFLVNITTPIPMPHFTSCGIAVGNTLEPVIGAWLLTRRNGFHRALDRRHDVRRLVFYGATISTMVSATVGVFVLCLGNADLWDMFARLWLQWWLGDAMGVLVVAPVLLVWSERRVVVDFWQRPWEAGLFLVGLTTIGLIIFAWPFEGNWKNAYWIYPFLIWAAVRLGPRGVVTGMVVASILAIGGTLNGTGPFVHNTTGTSHSLVHLQMFLGVGAVTGLTLAAVASESKRAERELRELNAQLQERVEQRTQKLEQMNAALRVSEEQVRLLLDCSAEGIYGADMQGLCTLANPACARLLGYRDAHELLGKNMHALMHHTRPDGAVYPVEECHIYQAFQQGVEIHIDDEVFWRADGTCFPVEYRSHPMRRDGQVIGAVVNFSDITDRQRAQQDLRQARDAAEAASRAKSEFLANMSHEIRTPMNGILGMTALTLDTKLTAEQRQFLEAVRESGESLLRLLNDILDFSKIEAGKLEFDEVDFSLDEAISGAVKALAHGAHEKGLEIIYHVAPDVPDGLVGDPGRLRQIIVNLLGNAVKFTARGEVAVSVHVEELSDDQVVLHVGVRDTGIGIAADQQRAIFEPFTQGDNSTTRRYGGTGLGLTISTQLVERMHGRIWLESEPGQGSTFHFTARLMRSKTVPAQDIPTPPIKLRGMPVLVVDDNPTNQRILEELLTRWQMRPTVLDNGIAALAALAKAHSTGEPFSLVLVDCMMPAMDGFTLAEHVKRQPGVNGVTVLMLTSAPRPGDAARCRELGIAGYLTKPARPLELFDAIVRALRISWHERKVSAPAVQEPISPDSPRLRVLLAEDNPINQQVATLMLEDLGHVVNLASNGREVLELLARETFDVILMDVQMPEMDGFAATAAIRSGEKVTGQHLPIIALTAHAMKGDRERCLAAGMDGYLAKPISPEELRKVIANVAQGRREFIPFETGNGMNSVLPAIDRAALLARVGNKRQRLCKLVDIFQHSCPGMLQAIRDALGRADAAGLSRAAHTLKGSVGNLGSTNAFAAAKKLEDVGASGDLSLAPAALAHLEREVERFQAELIKLSQEEQP